MLKGGGQFNPRSGGYITLRISGQYTCVFHINTRIKSFKGARIVFEYQTINENVEIINEAQITVACVKKSTGKACFPSKTISDTLKELIFK